MRKILNTQKGFSLVELLVGIGIAGGVALMGSQIMSEQLSHKKHLDDRSEIDKITQLVRYNLSDRSNCANNLAAFPPNLGHFSAAKKIANGGIIKVRPNGERHILVNVPSEHGAYSLENIEIVKNATNSNILDFVLSFNWGKRKFNNDNRENPDSSAKIIKRISILASIDPGPDGVIGTGNDDRWKCGEVLSDDKVALKRDLCTSLGGIAKWKNDIEQCQIDEVKCGHNEIPTMMSSMGSYRCRPTIELVKASDVIETASVPCPAGKTVSIVVENKKFKILCN